MQDACCQPSVTPDKPVSHAACSPPLLHAQNHQTPSLCKLGPSCMLIRRCTHSSLLHLLRQWGLVATVLALSGASSRLYCLSSAVRLWTLFYSSSPLLIYHPFSSPTPILLIPPASRTRTRTRTPTDTRTGGAMMFRQNRRVARVVLRGLAHGRHAQRAEHVADERARVAHHAARALAHAHPALERGVS